MFGRGLPVVFAMAFSISASAQAPATDRPWNADQLRWAETCDDWDDWDKPGPPFQVIGNTYYVGTCGISAILITGNEGHILIDGGTEGGARVVARNIEALGFKLSDVKILLHSHEHHDHVGGLADLQRMTGARLLASSEAAPVFRSGTASADDPQFAEHSRLPPARVDGIVRDGDVVKLGNLELHAIATPGHTPGALSWFWTSWQSDDVVTTIAYADSLSPISSDGYRFSDHPEYVAAYRAGLDKLAAIECRPLLTPHPSASGMRAKVLGEGGTRSPCSDYAAGIEVRLDERLYEEAGPE